MAKRNQHVVPLGNGWAVRVSGSVKASVITSRREEAIEYATGLAKKEQSEVIVHARNGKIRKLHNYAMDSKTS